MPRKTRVVTVCYRLAVLGRQNPGWGARSEQARELVRSILGETEGDAIANLDDRSTHAAAIFGEPRQQCLAGHAFRFAPFLRRHELVDAAYFARQPAQLVERERPFDQVTWLESHLLLHEKL